jgi:hypothetical protein
MHEHVIDYDIAGSDLLVSLAVPVSDCICDGSAIFDCIVGVGVHIFLIYPLAMADCVGTKLQDRDAAQDTSGELSLRCRW